MSMTIQKWGNSLGIRIPSTLAKQAGLSEGTAVDLEVIMDSLVIRRKHQDLEELLAGVTPENMHNEVDIGEAQGAESW